MDKKQNSVQSGRIIERIIIFALCLAVAGSIFYVLMFKYEPDHNALGALASVSMDVVGMIVLIMLTLNFSFDKGGMSRTTRFFRDLMLGTMYALFFDFLTWAFDGYLSYNDLTFAYIVCSLCMGSVLSGVFVFYLSSYLVDMYNLKSSYISAKVCFTINMLACMMTFAFALTGNAFVIEGGHYKTGSLYDIVTMVPIATLLYMTGYAIVHVKVIGLHDVIAVVGYILTMIMGAIIEETYDMGTTYAALTIADIFIFVMLQNKLLDRERKQKADLAEEIKSQYDILASMAGIYSYVNYVDIEDKYVSRFDVKDGKRENLDLAMDPHTNLNKGLFAKIKEEQKEDFWAYTDLSTLSARMGKEKIISMDFCHEEEGWLRAQYIRIGNPDADTIDRVIYAIRNIDEEKKNVEKWIRKSNTDELTGFYNRHAYEDEIALLEAGQLNENFVYISIDVNSLKLANDTLGHAAGDELIIGASQCMKRCFGSYGKLFRIGGDEFVALIFADEAQLEIIKKDIIEETDKWKGKLNSHLTVSCGYVTGKETAGLTLHQIAILADKRMYEDKSQYYRRKGIDRRGQRDAHVALCSLYTKILKINITDDTYQVVNMDENEQTKEMGYASTISKWLEDFGKSGYVHPEDLDEYLAKTNLGYISNHFRNNNSSLTVFYRRKYPEGYKQVMMELIPTNEYTDENQQLFLYVKSL